MTEKIGNTVIIAYEEERECQFCGKIRECRPYGPEGKDICFSCAMKPENIIVKDTFKALLINGGEEDEQKRPKGIGRTG